VVDVGHGMHLLRDPVDSLGRISVWHVWYFIRRRRIAV